MSFQVHARQHTAKGKGIGGHHSPKGGNIEWRLILPEGIYSVSETGEVRREVAYHKSRGPKCVLRPKTDRYGYCVVCICINNVRTWRTVHSLVAAAFLGPRPSGMQINHVNGDKTDNRPANLEYVTGQQNERHAAAHGLKARGERHHGAKLTAALVLELRRRNAAGASTRRLADEFGVSQTAVSHAICGRTWSHI